MLAMLWRGARPDRANFQPFDCSRDQAFKGPAVEHAFDERSPFRLAGGRESFSDPNHTRSGSELFGMGRGGEARSRPG